MNLIRENGKSTGNKNVIILAEQNLSDNTKIKTDEFNLISELDGKLSFDLDILEDVSRVEFLVI